MPPRVSSVLFCVSSVPRNVPSGPPHLQVLCSRRLWDDSGLEAHPDLGPEALVVGDSMGEVALKGLSAKMEVIHCV